MFTIYLGSNRADLAKTWSTRNFLFALEYFINCATNIRLFVGKSIQCCSCRKIIQVYVKTIMAILQNIGQPKFFTFHSQVPY
jgi:hypothetical protein